MPKKNGKYIRKEPDVKPVYSLKRRLKIKGIDKDTLIEAANMFDATVTMLNTLQALKKSPSDVEIWETVKETS